MSLFIKIITSVHINDKFCNKISSVLNSQHLICIFFIFFFISKLISIFKIFNGISLFKIKKFFFLISYLALIYFKIKRREKKMQLLVEEIKNAFIMYFF